MVSLDNYLPATIPYLSPFCKSPTPFGSFILCRAQSMVPTPVAARPCDALVSAILTALCDEQVLLYHDCHSECFMTTDLEPAYLLWCTTGTSMYVRLVFFLLYKVCPPTTQPRVNTIFGHYASFETKVGIYR